MPWKYTVPAWKYTVLKNIRFSVKYTVSCVKTVYFEVWGPYIFADCIFYVRTAYFQSWDRMSSARTVYFTCDPFLSLFLNLIKNSASLCYQHAAKTSTQTTSYEVQFGCETRNFASQISNQRELTGLCCSTSDFAKILKYFGET